MICFYTASEEARQVLAPPAPGQAEVSEESFSEGWQRSLYKFWRADKSYCDERFKLIPNVVSMSPYMKISVTYIIYIVINPVFVCSRKAHG